MAVPVHPSRQGADRHARALELWASGDGAGALTELRAAVADSLDLELLNDLGVIAAAILGDEAGRAILQTALIVDAEREDAITNLAALDELANEPYAARLEGATGPAAPSNSARREGAIVLGAGRSGTSAVTRSLNLLGLQLGADDDLLPPQVDNPRGFWESRELLEINDAVLEAVGGAWDTPPAPDHGFAVAESLRERARQAFHDLYPSGPWLWKDPRTSLTFPFWLDAVEIDPAIVIVHRNPLEVWRSLVARTGIADQYADKMPKAVALALWERCLRNSLRFATGRPTFVTGYEALLADPEGWATRGADFVRLLGVEPRADASEAIASFVDTSLRHSTHDAADLAADDLVSPAQRELASLLQCLEGVHERFNASALGPETSWVEPLLAERRRAHALRRATQHE